MSGKLAGIVWDLDLPHNEAWVLMSICDNAHHDGGKCYPSLGLTAWKTGYSDRQVRRILRSLEKKEILIRESRSGKSNLYDICLDNAPLKPPRKDTPDIMSGPDIAMSPGQNDTPDTQMSGDPGHPDVRLTDLNKKGRGGGRRRESPPALDSSSSSHSGSVRAQGLDSSLAVGGQPNPNQSPTNLSEEEQDRRQREKAARDKEDRIRNRQYPSLRDDSEYARHEGCGGLLTESGMCAQCKEQIHGVR